MSNNNDQVNLKEKAETTAKVDDFIQKAVNAGYEASLLRGIKRVKYRRQMYNQYMNKIRKARKLERKNRRKGRK